MGDASINITADALEYAEQKFLKLFGKDQGSTELKGWFRGLQQTAHTLAASVHCLGMRRPLPFDSIYQPTRLLVARDSGEASAEASSFAWENKVSRSILRGRAYEEKSIPICDFLQRDDDALIFGGPGWGKTTFLHHVFRTTVTNDDVLPVLISLRRTNALEDLERYVGECSRIQKKQRRACTLLLVDGYDEVKTEERKRVSEALLRFQAHRAGKFYLTCRDYYHVALLKAPEVRLEAFTRDDQIRFVGIFLAAFSVLRDDAKTVVSQLEERGFKEFLSHPLLLTLACIVRTTSSSVQPRSALRLLERAIDVLCLHWNEQKVIDRQRTTPLDGYDRERILKHIAYRARSPFVKRQRAEEITRKQLSLLGMDKVEPRDALIEIARFYGILVPAEDGYEFVHRTIHDFLAAKQWVESGEFARERSYEWNARTAYAACLLGDATDVLKQALEARDGLPTATEIIGNYAGFDYPTIADALFEYFAKPGRVLQYERRLHSETDSKYSPRIIGLLESDFIRLANSDFLNFIVDYFCERKSKVADLLVAYAATELYSRWMKLEHQTYAKAFAAYKTEIFTFAVPGAKQAQLQFLDPVPRNRMKDRKPPEVPEE